MSWGIALFIRRIFIPVRALMDIGEQAGDESGGKEYSSDESGGKEYSPDESGSHRMNICNKKKAATK